MRTVGGSVWQSFGYRLGCIMGTEESTQRVQTERDQEDLPVSEEKTERSRKRETGDAAARWWGNQKPIVSESQGEDGREDELTMSETPR